MTRTKLIPSIAFFSCLLLAAGVNSQQPPGDSEVPAREARPQLVEAEFDVEMHEIEFAMSERAVEEAQIEVKKAEVNVRGAEILAKKLGRLDQVELAKLEVKQAQIRLEMQRLRSKLARLNIERARARLQLKKPLLTEKRAKRTQVQLEYVDDLDIIVIRGPRSGVNKIKALIETAAKESAE